MSVSRPGAASMYCHVHCESRTTGKSWNEPECGKSTTSALWLATTCYRSNQRSHANPTRIAPGISLSERSKLWILAISCLVFAQACASILIPQGFALAVFTDVTQSILLLSGMAALAPNIVRNHGRARLFWALIAFGIALLLTY